VNFYFVTFSVTVFEIALPFFGVTVTVTLQEPAFNPLRVVPETLQNLDELATTFNLTFDVESTLSLANVAIDFAVADLEVVTLGEVTVDEVTVDEVTVDEVTVGLSKVPSAFNRKRGFVSIPFHLVKAPLINICWLESTTA
jgi:hypothetical protein